MAEHRTPRPPEKNPPDQAERDQIVNDLDCSILVEAAAGTGKTTKMVERMVALLREGKCTIDTLAAVTFTRKAAGELRTRFQLEIEEALAGPAGRGRDLLKEAQDNIELCFIGTIHSFCARLLRERPIEAGVGLMFEELDEEQDKRLRTEAWDLYVAELMAHDADRLLAELTGVGLQPGQLASAFLRFADFPDVDSWPVPEVSDDRLDTNHLRQQVRDLVKHIRELDPPLPEEWGSDKLIPKYRMLVRMSRHLNLNRTTDLLTLLQECKPVKPTLKYWPGGKGQARSEEEYLQAFFDDVVTPALTLWREQRYVTIIKILQQARNRYDGLRQERAQLNFQDLLIKAAALLCDRPNIRKYFRKRFSHLLVDEFQDTDPVQAEVMMFLTAANGQETHWRKCLPVPGSLFVVGDPKQSIYRFRRADIVTYNQVRRIIERSGGKVVSLWANFRSSHPVIDWVNEVFQGRFPERPTEQAPRYVPLEFARAHKATKALSGVHVINIPKSVGQGNAPAVDLESDLIARTIRSALKDKTPIARKPEALAAGLSAAANESDFLIITAKTKQLAEYARALQAYGIPHQVTGGSSLNEVDELRLLHLCLKAVVEPGNPVSLVALLRSELFGLSDVSLYAFKKQGGAFSYKSAVPAGFDTAHQFIDAFARLKAYSGWLRMLPAVSAIERIAADLGLAARAASGEEGDAGAGAFFKAIELLRTVQNWSATHLVEFLGQIILKDETHDGISVRPGDRPVVRIMNLHKAKGLEAPVVFLADPTGAQKIWEPEIHIDRSGDETRGYMAVTEPAGQYQTRVIAQPEGWEQFKEVEGEFADAEKERLRYVAATRAASMLVVVQRESYAAHNPWHCFQENLAGAKQLKTPGKMARATDALRDISEGDVTGAETRLLEGITVLRDPTFDTRAAKEFAMSEGEPQPDSLAIIFAAASSETQADADFSPHGADWGTVIHQLLEVAMTDRAAGLETLAASLLADRDLGAELAPQAVSVVQSVMNSEIWARARKSRRCLTEVPFQVTTDRLPGRRTDLPTLLRGAIDLVFEEENGWVIIDYKTDVIPAGGPDRLVEKYAPQLKLYGEVWAEVTGEKVAEIGLYSTAANATFMARLL